MSSWFSLPIPFKSPEDDDNPTATDPKLPALFRGVASFLAPPPANSASAAEGSDDRFVADSSQAIAGIRNDLVELGESFKSSFSLFSSNKAVSEISKLASNFLKFEDDAVKGELEEEQEEEEDDMIGITDEVVGFVRTISERPQLWTDFPISLPKDFHISDNQKQHVENIEQLVPCLGSLKQKLSNHLTDGQFWMIYFILLLPRLDENDLETLSSPEIVEAREMLLQQLQSKKNTESVPTNELETVERHSDGENQLPSTDTTVEPSSAVLDVEAITHLNIKQGNKDDAEDVSFSDLEDDDDADSADKDSGTMASHSKKASSSSESHEWIQLNENSNVWTGQQTTGQSTSRGKDKEPEGEESGDWLTVDDTDFDSLGAV
ncbi:unnamed protein product [Cuscuta europaea]|uniref:BSD domain-containing protein n=1 Tax=Cuscuta europaea TaxID=41803 RepID=A0A9P0ZMI2_CUSEU|nr:unnamed protein product [Cuscuta europaea]